MRFKSGHDAIQRMQAKPRHKRGGISRPSDDFDRSGPTLAAYVDEFLEYLRMRNRTERAVDTRRWDLHPFLMWTDERGLMYPDQITRSILESYQRYLWRYRKKNGKPLGITTQRQRLSVVRIFFAWLCRQRVLEANPASELEMPQAETRLPVESLSVQEVESVLAVPDLTNPLGLRDRAMLELLYSTGLRRSELVRLNVADLNRDKHILYVRQGKGRKDRVVPVGQRALRWVEKYLEDVRPLLVINPSEQTLFLSGYGEAIRPDTLGRKVTTYIRQANIGRKGSCHLFRHTCATLMLEGGADIRFIQQLLGHARLDTTAIYTQVSIVQLQAVHAKTHPAEKRVGRSTTK